MHAKPLRHKVAVKYLHLPPELVTMKKTTIDSENQAKKTVENIVLTHVSIIIMLVCAVKLPVEHAVLHGFLKVSVELKEVSVIPPRQERNLSTLCSHSTLVTQALSERCTNTVTGKLPDEKNPSCLA